MRNSRWRDVPRQRLHLRIGGGQCVGGRGQHEQHRRVGRRAARRQAVDQPDVERRAVGIEPGGEAVLPGSAAFDQARQPARRRQQRHAFGSRQQHVAQRPVTRQHVRELVASLQPQRVRGLALHGVDDQHLLPDARQRGGEVQRHLGRAVAGDAHRRPGATGEQRAQPGGLVGVGVTHARPPNSRPAAARARRPAARTASRRRAGRRCAANGARGSWRWARAGPPARAGRWRRTAAAADAGSRRRAPGPVAPPRRSW